MDIEYMIWFQLNSLTTNRPLSPSTPPIKYQTANTPPPPYNQGQCYVLIVAIKLLYITAPPILDIAFLGVNRNFPFILHLFL